MYRWASTRRERTGTSCYSNSVFFGPLIVLHDPCTVQCTGEQADHPARGGRGREHHVIQTVYSLTLLLYAMTPVLYRWASWSSCMRRERTGMPCLTFRDLFRQRLGKNASHKLLAHRGIMKQNCRKLNVKLWISMYYCFYVEEHFHSSFHIWRSKEWLHCLKKGGTFSR